MQRIIAALPFVHVRPPRPAWHAQVV